MPGVVDSHVHLLPERLGRAIRDFFDTHHYDTSTFAYPLNHDAVCELLADDGIATVWSLPYARRPGTADQLNEAMAATVLAQRSGPVEVIGGATVHPGDPLPADIVRRGVEDLGLRVLKLHCSVGDYEPDDPRLDPVWRYVSDIALPVVIHAGHSSAGDTAPADVAAIARLAQRWPEVVVIVAHCGHPATAEVIELVRAHGNVHADLTPVVDSLVAIDRATLSELSSKLLFGSDAPNTGFRASAALAGLGLGPEGTAGLEASAAITGGNARRIQSGIGV